MLNLPPILQIHLQMFDEHQLFKDIVLEDPPTYLSASEICSNLCSNCTYKLTCSIDIIGMKLNSGHNVAMYYDVSNLEAYKVMLNDEHSMNLSFLDKRSQHQNPYLLFYQLRPCPNHKNK